MGRQVTVADPSTRALQRLTDCREYFDGRVPRRPRRREQRAEATALGRVSATAPPAAAFLDLGPLDAPCGVRIECDGAKVTIRLPPGSSPALIAELALRLGARP